MQPNTSGQTARGSVRTFAEYLRRFRPSKHQETLTPVERFREQVRDDMAWTVPPSHRPTCRVSGEPCTSWTCLFDTCADAVTNAADAETWEVPDA